MENKLIDFYRNKVKQSWKVTFISAMIFGLLAHTYKFTNHLLNHDALFNYYEPQNMIRSGRWFLSIACGFSSYFNLHWVIGIFSIVLIALTSVVIVDIFDIEKPIPALIIGGMLVTFPAITETFYFGYTADGYMLAMLLATLCVKFSIISEKKIWKLFAATIFICFSCGIYQAYVSFALVLSLIYFMTELLKNNNTTKEYVSWIKNQIIIYAGGIILYMIIWKVCLYLQSTAASAYFGMNSVGQFDFASIPSTLILILKNFFLFFFKNNSLKHGLNSWTALNILFILLSAVVLISSVLKSKLYKRKLPFLFFCLSFSIIPLCVFIWFFASGNVAFYSTRMEQSLALIFIFVAVIAYNYAKPKLATAISLILTLIIFNNALIANIFYFNMERCERQSYGNAIELSTRIHLKDDGNIKYVAFVGVMNNRSDTYYDNALAQSTGPLGLLDKTLLFQYKTCLYMANELGFTLSYYSDTKNQLPQIEYLDDFPTSYGWSFYFPIASDEIMKNIYPTPEFTEMPCWPAADSVKIFGDTIVVKLSD